MFGARSENHSRPIHAIIPKLYDRKFTSRPGGIFWFTRVFLTSVVKSL